MQKGFLFKIGICLGALSLVLYRHIEGQNQITALKIALPSTVKELKLLKEKTMRLRYEIEQFESPEHLLALANKSEYSHLKYPLSKEIIAMKRGFPILEEEAALPSQHLNAPLIMASHGPLPE
jgi:hypothetical protein